MAGRLCRTRAGTPPRALWCIAACLGRDTPPVWRVGTSRQLSRKHSGGTAGRCFQIQRPQGGRLHGIPVFSPMTGTAVLLADIIGRHFPHLQFGVATSMIGRYVSLL
jgi:hypothetical protein